MKHYHIRRLTLACSLIVLLSACAGASGAPGTNGTPSQSEQAPDTGQADSEQPPENIAVDPAVEDTPQPAPEDPSARVVTFSTADGITLSGTLFGLGDTALIFSHMFPTEQTSWHPFAQLAADQGYLSLAYDFRGYGASGGEVDILSLEQDIVAAYDFMRGRGVQRIVLIGASMGGTASLKVAATNPEGLVGLALLSTPQTFNELEVSQAELGALGVPSLWLSARQDIVTREFEDMHTLAAGDKSLWIFESSGTHGTFMFDAPLDGRELEQRLLDFMARVAPLSA